MVTAAKVTVGQVLPPQAAWCIAPIKALYRTFHLQLPRRLLYCTAGLKHIQLYYMLLLHTSAHTQRYSQRSRHFKAFPPL